MSTGSGRAPAGPGAAAGVPTIWAALRSQPERPARLLAVVPHGGAGPTSAWALAQAVPADWAVLALCLPGREHRIAEPPEWEPAQVVAAAAGQLRAVAADPAYRDVPITVIGQCLGAWLGYAILAAAGPSVQASCRTLVVASQKPWHAPRQHRALPADPAAMWARLARSGDTPAEVAADPEFRELLEPIVRADHAAVAGFATAAAPLPCALVALTGAHDPAAARLDPAGWARYTPALRTACLDCGHLPVQERPADVARLLAGC